MLEKTFILCIEKMHWKHYNFDLLTGGQCVKNRWEPKFNCDGVKQCKSKFLKNDKKFKRRGQTKFDILSQSFETEFSFECEKYRCGTLKIAFRIPKNLMSQRTKFMVFG